MDTVHILVNAVLLIMLDHKNGSMTVSDVGYKGFSDHRFGIFKHACMPCLLIRAPTELEFSQPSAIDQ